jgi:hypothetical protein
MSILRAFSVVTLLFAACLETRAAAPPAPALWAQLAELTASDGTQGYGLGYSTAISGNTAVTGSIGEPVVYVFVKPSSGWATMTQTAELTASDGTGFGAVAINGDTIVARNSVNSQVYVFVKPANGWANMTETAILSSSDQAADLGVSVSISGNTVVAGSSGAQNGSGPSTAYVFVKPANGWANMTETAELTPSDGGGPYFAAAVSGNTVVVGALSTTVGGNYQQGAAYVYVKPANGWANMTETAKLTASDGAATDELGTSVAINGSTVIAGAPLAKIGSHQFQGAAYVFVKPANGWTTMTQTAKLTASDGRYKSELGASVSISGNTVVAGAPYQPLGTTELQGAAYIYTKPTTGWANKTQNARLTASDGSGALATSVSISGPTAAAGAPGVKIGNIAQGAIYVFGATQSKSAAGRPKSATLARKSGS